MMANRTTNLTLVGLIALMIGGSSQPASAHASLVRADPPRGASLEAPSPEWTIVFSEAIEPDVSSFALYDAAGARLRQLEFFLSENDEVAIVTIGGELSPGVYTLAARVLSAVDGHVTRTTVPFAIGQSMSRADVEMAASSEDMSGASASRSVGRWLHLTAILLAFGLLTLPRVFRLGNGSNDRTRRLFWGAWTIALLTLIGDVAFQATDLDAPLTSLLTGSQWGHLQSAKFGLMLATGLLVSAGRATGWAMALGAILMGLALLAGALSGHSAGLGPLGVLADWGHQLAIALWLGGLVHLALGGRPHRPTENERRAWMTAVPRFSNVALAGVALIVVSGVFLGLQHVPSWGALVGSLYGRLLLIKAGLLLPVLVLAGVNRRILLPTASSSSSDGSTGDNVSTAMSRLRRLMIGEVALIAVILGAAGVLTLSAPPSHSIGSSQGGTEAERYVQSLEDHRIALTIAPFRVGHNTFTIRVETGDGEPVADVLRTWLDFEYRNEDLGITTVDAEPMDDGTYRVEGAFLSLAGDWQVTVWSRMKGRAEDLSATFEMTVGDDASTSNAADE